MKHVIPIRMITPLGNYFSSVTARPWARGSTIYPFGGDFWTPPVPTPPAVYLETAADGTGSRLSPANDYAIYWAEDPPGPIELFAILRDANGMFVENVSASYVLDIISGTRYHLAHVGFTTWDGKSVGIGGGHIPDLPGRFSGRLKAVVDGLPSEWTGVLHWNPSIGNPNLITNISEIPLSWHTLQVDFYYTMEDPEVWLLDSFIIYGPEPPPYWNPDNIAMWRRDGGGYSTLHLGPGLLGIGNDWSFVSPLGEIYQPARYAYTPYGNYITNSSNTYAVISPYIA